MTKREKVLITIFMVITGLFAGITTEQGNKISELEQELQETQEQLLISNDQLKMIEMRNEAIKYMEEEE